VQQTREKLGNNQMKDLASEMNVFLPNGFSSNIVPILIISSTFLVGCVGENARTVARIELANVVAYEQEVDKKINAEKEFYAQTAKNIAERFDALTPTMAENAIISGSMHSADLFIGKSRNTITDWDLMEFIASAIADYQAKRQQWEEVNGKIASDLKTAIVPLNFSKMKLREVRKKLEKLQSEPSGSDELEEVQQFLQTTKDAYEKIENERSGD